MLARLKKLDWLWCERKFGKPRTFQLIIQFEEGGVALELTTGDTAQKIVNELRRIATKIEMRTSACANAQTLVLTEKNNT